MQLDYDVVIATRNRPDALQMSLPLIGQQTRLPKTLIVVDASDDPAAVAQVIAGQRFGSKVKVVLERSTLANASHQRNRGLQHVTSEITLLPDDDSLWFPDTAETVMTAYEADDAGSVGGVSSTQTNVSPLGQATLAYKVDRKFLLKKALDPARNAVEDVLFESPYRSFTRECPAFAHPPAWALQRGLKPLGTMTGFRMSFRSSVLKANLFDEDLGHRNGWCLWEDAELSLRVLASGKSLLAVPESRVFHHSFPSKRANGFDYGFSQIANYAYVCCKVMPHTPALRRRLDKYLQYKLFLYGLSKDGYGRDRYRGGLAAWRGLDTLWDAPRGHVADAFKKLSDAHPKDTL